MIKRATNSLPPYHTRRIMQICLAVSFMIHACIVLAFQKTIPWLGMNEELRTYYVELLRPPVHDLDEGKNSEIEKTLDRKEPELTFEGGQETISLDTEDERYVDYARVIKSKILKLWTYPPGAKKDLLEGGLVVIFSLASDGDMTRIQIKKASTHDILDREALRAIKSAVPFPPFPDHILVGRLNIIANFDYRLTSAKANP